MKKNLENYRKSYGKSALSEKQLLGNPYSLFRRWFDEVEQSREIEEPNAMSISTKGLDGFPKTRVVLLKEIRPEGFVFYTNYGSEKARAIEQNPEVCLSFFWPPLQRQVIIKGTTQKLSSEESDAYFQKRPKGSQLGALVSPQSNKIEDREFLEKRLAELKEEYADRKVERPENWGGFLVSPISFEFWQGRENRLHDRFLFELDQNAWEVHRLAP